jgi:Flp pilus assembly protein TadB
VIAILGACRARAHTARVQRSDMFRASAHAARLMDGKGGVGQSLKRLPQQSCALRTQAGLVSSSNAWRLLARLARCLLTFLAVCLGVAPRRLANLALR